jgi:hypothetical protein
MRALTPVEEHEFQRAIDTRNDKRLAEAEQLGRDIETNADLRYAVMIRVRLATVWTWMTWQVYDTYEQAVSHAKDGNKVVRFRSAEWAALRRHTDPALASAITVPQSVRLQWREGESMLEFVHRCLDRYGVDRPSAPSDANQRIEHYRFQLDSDRSSVALDRQKVALGILIDFIDAILNWLNQWEVRELERIHAKQVPAWLENLRERARRALEHEIVN